MVSAPASRPCSLSYSRISSTSPTVAGGVAAGEVSLGSPGPGLEGGVALESVVGHQTADPGLGQAVGAGGLSLG